MSERDTENFDLDDEFLGEAPEENLDYDRFMDRAEKRPRGAVPVKKGQAAWSKLEEVLADKRLEKDLREFFDDKA